MEQPALNNEHPLRYRIDKFIRHAAMRTIGWLFAGAERHDLDPRTDSIKKILLVRANFRMGNALLALPAVAAFRQNFPAARIDFLGSPVSRVLFENQPLNNHYEAPRRFPSVLWRHPVLLRKIRSTAYDLAVDVSCSQSAMGSLIVGLSGARIRAGCAGKWDRFFNLKIAKLAEANKYRKLTEFLTALHLENVPALGSLQFSPAERTEASAKINSAAGRNAGPTVGVFVGGRKLRGKRWPLENFLAVIHGLRGKGIRVMVFLGPEENDIADSLKSSLNPSVAIIFEPSVRKFAALVSNLDLFICSDSGPMHLACTVGVRVLALFQERDVARWAPPSAARIVYGPDGVTAAKVLSTALEELSRGSAATESQAKLKAASMTNPSSALG